MDMMSFNPYWSVRDTHVFSCFSWTASQANGSLGSLRPCSPWQTLRTSIAPVALQKKRCHRVHSDINATTSNRK